MLNSNLDFFISPKVFEIGEHKGQYFISMELLGPSLDKIKFSFPELTIKDKIYLLIKMLNAIESLHKAGYIHRDIKPANFAFGRDGFSDVYLIDFSLARRHLDCNQVPFKRRENTIFKGTLAYSSLNAHNHEELSRRDDLWSFLCIALEFLNEKLPWKVDNMNFVLLLLRTM